VFVGHGDDLEITDNVIAGNGTATEGFEQNRQAGLRGGIYVRFAGALTCQYSASSGRKPSLGVHDTRVDQPAGRALTAFAFGPVSCADNHLNSGLTGLFQFLDAAFGAVLVVNLGGIHRFLARTLGASIGRGAHVRVDDELPPAHPRLRAPRRDAVCAAGQRACRHAPRARLPRPAPRYQSKAATRSRDQAARAHLAGGGVRTGPAPRS
jgi:hypothetical protein